MCSPSNGTKGAFASPEEPGTTLFLEPQSHIQKLSHLTAALLRTRIDIATDIGPRAVVLVFVPTQLRCWHPPQHSISSLPTIKAGQAELSEAEAEVPSSRLLGCSLMLSSLSFDVARLRLVLWVVPIQAASPRRKCVLSSVLLSCLRCSYHSKADH